jgi:hypothetical protein
MLPTLLTPLLPLLWALIATVYWWRQLSVPWLFLVAGFLALLGVQSVVSFIWDYWPHLSGRHFLEANDFVAGKAPSEAAVQRVLEEKNRVAITQAALVLMAAIPLLWWLKSGLSIK